ncbi:hypothetical protein OAI91_00455 [bacterium]|nr:hypothetical protein [bacterium]
MSTENGVRLQVDEQKRIGVSDVISMLKGLRSEVVIKIIRTSDTKGKADTLTFGNDDGKDGSKNSTHSINQLSAVKGKTELPQIRELNEIAALLRSMDDQQNQISS